MTDLPKLMLCPLRDGYSYQLGNNTVTTQVSEGMPRQRKNGVGVTHRVSPTFRCTESKYQYLMSFLRAYEAQPFLAHLVLDDTKIKWYECRVVQQGTPVQHGTYKIWDVQLALVAKPHKYDIELDKSLVTLYNLTDGDYSKFTNIIEKLVNEDLPESMESL